MNYNPLYGWDDGTTERVIDWVKNKNGIATACWHINLPVDFENYELGEALITTVLLIISICSHIIRTVPIKFVSVLINCFTVTVNFIFFSLAVNTFV